MNKTCKMYMKTAVKLAQNGGSDVYPNPQVGCVIVKDNKIVGQGYHEFFGGPHAEINALAQAGKNAAAADLYVTLEPCNTYGKRPPCVQAILKSGIKRVFFAINDPYSAKGADFLRANGVEVCGGVCKKEASALVKDFFRHKKSKPLISMKAAMTLDGKIATSVYDSKWISSAKSRDFVHKLRTRYDAVLIGKNTALEDNPALTSHGKGRNPIRVLIDFNLDVPPDYYLYGGSVPTIVVYDERQKIMYPGVEKMIFVPVDASKAKKDFKIIRDTLLGLGIKTILIEGGGEIFSSALFSGCVDDLYIFIAPKIIGGKNAVSVVGGAGVDRIDYALKIKNMRISKFGDDFLVRGKCLQE